MQRCLQGRRVDTSIARRFDGKLIQAEKGIDKRLSFFCPGCKQEVYAATEGKKQRPHFRHKHLDERSGCTEPESYIHWITKELFAEFFREIESFFVDIPCHAVCHASGRCRERKMLSFDLKKRFPYIKVEKFDQGYRPDCILYNDDGEKLYLEVYHTHRISEDKINLGVPIIEIEVLSEKDVNRIVDNQKIDEKIIGYRIYNDSSLLPVSITFDCGDKCKTRSGYDQSIAQEKKKNSYWSQIFSSEASFHGGTRERKSASNSLVSESISRINQKINKNKDDSMGDKQIQKQMCFDFEEDDDSAPLSQ